MRVTLILCFLFFCALYAADDIGGFSIDKVREQRGESTLVDDSLAVATGEEEVATSPFILVLRIIGSLAIVTLFIFGIVFGVKKSGFLKKQEVSTAGTFELLERFQTGKQGNALLMVRFNSSVLVLGQTNENISLIKSIEGDEAARIIEDKREGMTVSGFQASLNNFISSMKSEGQNG